MKKLKKIAMTAMLTLLFALLFITTVNAAETVSLTSNKTTVKAGEEFIVTVNIKCDDAINGFTGKLEWNENQIELVNKTLDSNFVDLSSGFPQMEVLTNSDSVKETNLYKVTFKAKKSVSAGEMQIKLTGIFVSTFSNDTSLSDKTLKITIKADEPSPSPSVKPSPSPSVKPSPSPSVTPTPSDDPNPTEKKLSKIEVTKKPTKTSYKAGEKFDKTGMVITATYSDGTTRIITSYTLKPSTSTKLTTSDKYVTISYTEGGVTKTTTLAITVAKDNTVADKDHEDAGTMGLLIPMLVLVALVPVSYIGYRKYKNV